MMNNILQQTDFYWVLAWLIHMNTLKDTQEEDDNNLAISVFADMCQTKHASHHDVNL